MVGRLLSNERKEAVTAEPQIRSNPELFFGPSFETGISQVWRKLTTATLGHTR